MPETRKDNIIKGKVQQFKGNNTTNAPELFIIVNEVCGFSEDEEIVVLKCSEFPELTRIKDSVELRHKIDEHSERSKRVRELKQKLESAQEAHAESLNVLKIKTDLEIDSLKKENEGLMTENKELTMRLKDVTRRINELNSLLNDL